MKNSVNHIRRSQTEIRALLKKKEEGNLTVKEFCKLHQIHKATFYNWRNKYAPKIRKPEEFIAVQFNDITPEPALFAEIELSAKPIIRLFHKVDPAFVKALL